MFALINNAIEYQEDINIEAEHRDSTTKGYVMIRVESEKVKLTKLGLVFAKWILGFILAAVMMRYAFDIFF